MLNSHGQKKEERAQNCLKCIVVLIIISAIILCFGVYKRKYSQKATIVNVGEAISKNVEPLRTIGFPLWGFMVAGLLIVALFGLFVWKTIMVSTQSDIEDQIPMSTTNTEIAMQYLRENFPVSCTCVVITVTGFLGFGAFRHLGLPTTLTPASAFRNFGLPMTLTPAFELEPYNLYVPFEELDKMPSEKVNTLINRALDDHSSEAIKNAFRRAMAGNTSMSMIGLKNLFLQVAISAMQDNLGMKNEINQVGDFDKIYTDNQRKYTDRIKKYEDKRILESKRLTRIKFDIATFIKQTGSETLTTDSSTWSLLTMYKMCPRTDLDPEYSSKFAQPHHAHVDPDTGASMLWGPNGPERQDCIQGQRTCWIFAVLAALAQTNPQHIKRMIRPSSQNQGLFDIDLFPNTIKVRRTSADDWVKYNESDITSPDEAEIRKRFNTHVRPKTGDWIHDWNGVESMLGHAQRKTITVSESVPFDFWSRFSEHRYIWPILIFKAIVAHYHETKELGSPPRGCKPWEFLQTFSAKGGDQWFIMSLLTGQRAFEKAKYGDIVGVCGYLGEKYLVGCGFGDHDYCIYKATNSEIYLFDPNNYVDYSKIQGADPEHCTRVKNDRGCWKMSIDDFKTRPFRPDKYGSTKPHLRICRPPEPGIWDA